MKQSIDSRTFNQHSKINDNFVPYKESLTLKKLGLNQEYYFGVYPKEPYNIDGNIRKTTYQENGDAPLYQQAFKFFRDKYKLSGNCELIAISYLGDNYQFKIINFADFVDEDTTLIVNGFDSYEKAQFACLKKIIELL